VDNQAVARIGKEENVPDNVVLASAGDEKILYGDVKKILRGLSPGGAPQGQPDLSKNPVLVGNILERELTMRALSAYAKKQGSTARKGTRRCARRWSGSSSGAWWPTIIAAKNVEVTDRRSRRLRGALRDDGAGREEGSAGHGQGARSGRRCGTQKGAKAVEAYLDELKKKAKITVNDAVLPRFSLRSGVREGRIDVPALMGARLLAFATVLSLLPLAVGVAAEREAPPWRSGGGRNRVAERDDRPDFTVLDVEGHPFRLSEEASRKPVLLLFWSVFCDPCRAETGDPSEGA